LHPVHPASRILTYLLAALVIPGLPFFMLLPGLGLALLLLLKLRRSPWPLLWRTRWLLLVLVVGYAWGLPGDPLIPLAGEYSPSLEGSLHGVRQATGLLVVLLWLDILVLAQTAEALLGGLYQLARPLGVLGVDRARLALRLGLTLKAIEGLERGRGNLLRLLSRDTGPDLPSTLRIDTLAFRRQDYLIPGLLLGCMLVIWFSA
jgi:energy-coupling factor transport system permease protein